VKRFYFATFQDKPVRVTPDGKIISGKAFSGMMVERWARVFGSSAREAQRYFLEGNVSKWFTR
jgi:sucrose-6-phosphate hydrolase SacC (GH32 family)